jgi:hypothetical protein
MRRPEVRPISDGERSRICRPRNDAASGLQQHVWPRLRPTKPFCVVGRGKPSAGPLSEDLYFESAQIVSKPAMARPVGDWKLHASLSSARSTRWNWEAMFGGRMSICQHKS